jgi:hypothetical protein
VYTADPTAPHVQRIVLVPVRHGVLTLPPVAVQLVDPEPTAADVATPLQTPKAATPTTPAAGAQQRRAPSVLCETYIANAAQGVRVLPAQTDMTALVPITTQWD